ncbi:hypothetical protein [Mesorhizobium sp. CAU 1732]|uniref:hypothetical protein n=1 Tax=Mesorhizobium sp. CAU 1732 TaxID=3140358 RepID=UPI0032601197
MIELTMNFVLKFIHIFGLMLGAASGFGAMVVTRQIRRGAVPSPQLTALRPHFGRLGLAGIVLIWLSGLGLWLFRYDMMDLGEAYTAKLVISFLLLLVILVLSVAMSRMQGTVTPPSWMRMLGMTTPILTLAAMGLGVWVFI